MNKINNFIYFGIIFYMYYPLKKIFVKKNTLKYKYSYLIV